MSTTTEHPAYDERLAFGSRERHQAASLLRARYENGATVRLLAHDYGRSYGATHRLLTEAGTRMRPRGGKRKGAAS